MVQGAPVQSATGDPSGTALMGDMAEFDPITRRGWPSELIDDDDVDRPAIALEDQRSRLEYLDEALDITRVHESYAT